MQKDNEEEMIEAFLLQRQKKRKTQKMNQQKPEGRKKVPETHIVHSDNFVDFVNKSPKKKLKFQDLPQDIDFFLTEIYSYSGRLFMTGIMDNGQTLNVIAHDLFRELYFVLKGERGESSEISEQFIQEAVLEIKSRLRQNGLREGDFTCDVQKKQYVFEIQGIPRQKRPYVKVRYNFKAELRQQPEPDWEGGTYKYVFGTTYTPLQLLIINKNIKGPSWITLEKKDLRCNERNAQFGLCVDIGFPELIQINTDRVEPPCLRVLSFSLKSVIPATITTKKYFPTDRKDQTHIYAISYHYCESYNVSIKDPRPKLKHKTYYLKEFGQHSNPEFVKCDSQMIMLSRFQADLKFLDPDFLVCHDSSKILDTLICRTMKLGDRNTKTKFGRLNFVRDLSKTNQTQRINTFIAGRLLVDTFNHSKQMIKSIDYELQSMAKHIKPERNFVGISDEQAKVLLCENKPLPIINKCRQESEVTFNLMNHLQIIQITRQITNICGNLWKRSLQNKRAERNEFLIMHECWERDLIIPDKFRKVEEDEVENRKKYQGGMVLQPEKGFYSDYILLLDFNSLYPSIIRQYNVCFSIIDRPKLSLDFYYQSKQRKKEKKNKDRYQEDEAEDAAIEQMFNNVQKVSHRKQWGFLPELIDYIVQKRKECKRKMKRKGNTPAEVVILDIQQKCYKLVANSIYGCLGFSVSRFYSRPLASLITKKGRDSLLAAKEIVSKRGGVRVIYGDTDSLMIEPANLGSEDKNTEADKLISLKVVADQLKSEINKMYTFLEIDIDGIFKPLILLMKKKYVANKLCNFDEIIMGGTTQPKFSLEYKGIQIVRRDGCKIARETLQKVINILVKPGPLDLDQRYLQIIDFFTKLKDEIVKRPTEDFLFSKQLSKKPKQYVNGETIPHVKVALDRLKNGEKEESLVNHTIYYLICKSEENDSLAKCSYDLKSFERSRKFTPEKALQIDYDHYKSVIIEPIGRLLLHVNNQIYDQLISILEISKKRQRALKDKMNDEIDEAETFGETLSQNFRSKGRELVQEMGEFVCPKCSHSCSLIDADKGFVFKTVCKSCPDNPFNLTNVIYNKIWYRMKQDIEKYYNNKKACKCTKHYELTPITPCCEIDKKYKGKGDITFKLHNFLYLCKDICDHTLEQLSKEASSSSKGLEQINRMIERFLSQESRYEDVSSIFSKLRLS